MITMKLKYKTDNSSAILDLIKNYNSIYHLVYNYLFDNSKASTKDIMAFLKTKNNINLDTYFKNGAIYDVKTTFAMNKSNTKKNIFGGRKLFLDRLHNKITKEEFQLKKLRPLQVVGAAYNNGNCKFKILSNSQILFKPNGKEHYVLNLESVGKNYRKKLDTLIVAQANKQLPITYRLSTDYIYIMSDESTLEPIKETIKKKDRIFSIDMNPNYIGWSVIDWLDSDKYHIIKSGIVSLKPLNDYENSLTVSSDSPEKKYCTNKRKHEIINICYQLCKTANHYKCELFSLEDLSIISKDNHMGRKFNKLVNNQWNRNLLENIIKKLCDVYSIKVTKVNPAYSSIQGNLTYRSEHLPDMILSSIEISRRAYELHHQYNLKDKPQIRNIIFNNSENSISRIRQSLEELKYSVEFKELRELYNVILHQKSESCKYRFSIEEAIKCHPNSFSSLNHIKAYKILYIF